MMILVSFLLLVAGVAFAFLMILDMIPVNFFFVFLSYACSTAGLLMGFVGASSYIRRRTR